MDFFIFYPYNCYMEIKKEDYSNLLDEITLSVDEILTQIGSITLNFDKVINKSIENDSKLPPFIKTFYYFILIYNKIPTQEEFWDEYIKDDYVTDIIKDKDKKVGLKSRLFRVYPSLVRDIHFSLLLKDKSKNCDVIYNIDLDYFNGIDILIEYKKNLYGINLYVDTGRSKYYRGKKYGRHKKITNVTTIDIPVIFSEDNKHKDFFLYGEEQINLIKNNLINLSF